MSDLISRSALIAEIKDEVRWTYDSKGDALYIVNAAPAVDAVPVVRCFECKHRGKEDACPMWSREQPTTDWDEYCSRGERKDNV